MPRSVSFFAGRRRTRALGHGYRLGVFCGVGVHVIDCARVDVSRVRSTCTIVVRFIRTPFGDRSKRHAQERLGGTAAERGREGVRSRVRRRRRASRLRGMLPRELTALRDNQSRPRSCLGPISARTPRCRHDDPSAAASATILPSSAKTGRRDRALQYDYAAYLQNTTTTAATTAAARLHP